MGSRMGGLNGIWDNWNPVWNMQLRLDPFFKTIKCFLDADHLKDSDQFVGSKYHTNRKYPNALQPYAEQMTQYMVMQSYTCIARRW